jgi:transcriptional regulator with XRE-family HTH domain
MDGKLIRKIRRLAGVSQAELAERCGLSQALICMIENGERTATEEVVSRLADVFGVEANLLAAARSPEAQKRPLLSAGQVRCVQAKLRVLAAAVDEAEASTAKINDEEGRCE